jgi:hypothetical protein
MNNKNRRKNFKTCIYLKQKASLPQIVLKNRNDSIDTIWCSPSNESLYRHQMKLQLQNHENLLLFNFKTFPFELIQILLFAFTNCYYDLYQWWPTFLPGVL